MVTTPFLQMGNFLNTLLLLSLIIFPKPVRRLRANPEYIDRARGKALVGNLTGKLIAGSLGGAAATMAVPNTMRLKGWSDVIASGAVAIGGGIAVNALVIG